MTRSRLNLRYSGSDSSSSDDEKDLDYEPPTQDSASESISDDEEENHETVATEPSKSYWTSNRRRYLAIACLFSLAVFSTFENWHIVRPILIDYTELAHNLVF